MMDNNVEKLVKMEKADSFPKKKFSYTSSSERLGDFKFLIKNDIFIYVLHDFLKLSTFCNIHLNSNFYTFKQ
jgi:hypothetical protein